MADLLSDEDTLKAIADSLVGYLKLPFSGDSVPGGLMETIISSVRGGSVLKTYDFVDVINQTDKIGWQVKSTKESTPVTWKRAKIPDAANLIAASRESEEGLAALGTAIIKYCNDHAKESLERYDLNEIGYARLIVHEDNNLTYFERKLCSRDDPIVFPEDGFKWAWSVAKKTTKKEQLSALHGTHIESGKKWFAWHGLGENQLHFSGEGSWWPKKTDNCIKFQFPADRLSEQKFMDVLKSLA